MRCTGEQGWEGTAETLEWAAWFGQRAGPWSTHLIPLGDGVAAATTLGSGAPVSLPCPLSLSLDAGPPLTMETPTFSSFLEGPFLDPSESP